jgi:hypothetical protein
MFSEKGSVKPPHSKAGSVPQVAKKCGDFRKAGSLRYAALSRSTLLCNLQPCFAKPVDQVPD